MKNTGRIILSIILIFIGSTLYAAEVETELSPSKISAGESAALRISITGKSSKVKPVKFPAINGLKITFSGSSRSFQFVNGKSWSGTVLNFSIYGEKKGEYKIPPFILEADGEKVSSREVKLSVVESSPGSNGGPVRGDIELSSESVYIGEPVIMRYFVNNGSGDSVRIERFIKQPLAKGFVMKELDEKLDESGRTYAGSFCLIPLDKGLHNIGGGAVEVILDSAEDFFAMNKRGGLSFPVRKISVVPIPANGKPDNFTGDVGEFKIEAEVPAGKFKLFEEIIIPVKISGRGNLLTLSKPKIENEQGIKFVVEEKEQTLTSSDKDLTGEKKFLITLIPQSQKDNENLNPGRIFIEYFNPYKKIYERAESMPLSFEIQKSGNGVEKGEVQFSADISKGNKFNYLYIALIVSGLAAGVIVLVMWEKKKLRIIKAELGSDTPAENMPEVVNIKNDVLKNLQISINEKNRDMFLLNADRGINQMNAEKLTPSELIKYDLLKEKIYYCRYGGGAFEESEMKDLYDYLKRSMK